MDTILLNAQAVVLMQQGSIQEAISVFRTALGEHLRCPPADDDHQQEDMDTTDNPTPNLLSVRSVPLEHSLLNYSSCQDHHAFSLFDRALVFDDAELEAASSIAGQDYVSAVILFNMGLALQLQGTQDVGPLQASYLKALRFYKMATEILERCTNSDDEVNCLVYLAVANNMGHIYLTFCETSKAKQCLEWLQNILKAARDSADAYILSDECHLFRMNILIVHRQNAVAAAAA
jgi:tetratricopeptide (TPR) repeat protein